MGLISYEVADHVAVLTMDSGENRFNPPFLESFHSVLNEIEEGTEATVLVVRSAHEKIFSNGIDLEWLVSALKSGDKETTRRFLHQLNDLLKRVLLYPMITVAAINGHAFAGGAVLCCAFDFRFMRSDRGFFCLPEVDLQIPFLPGMVALLRKAIPEWLLPELMLTGRRLTADECQKGRIVKKACHVDQLMDEVIAFAREQNKARKIVSELKMRAYGHIVRIMESEDVRHIQGEI